MERHRQTQYRNKEFHNAKMTKDEVLESCKAEDQVTHSQTLYRLQVLGV